MYYYNRAFPLKTTFVKDKFENKWITKGLIISSNRMRFLNSLKRTTNISRESLEYIKRYQIIYRKVLKEAKKRENDRFVTSAKNNKSNVAVNK
jgi:hypothetical protein